MTENEILISFLQSWIKSFELVISQLEQKGPGDLPPDIHEAMLAGMRSKVEDLREELALLP